MDLNQIIVIIIVILASLIAVFGIYFLIVFLMNRKREKKVKTIFDPTNLVEEESLMNVMDEKRNFEFQEQPKQEEKFIFGSEEVKIVQSDSLSQEKKVNPFGVDLTLHSNDNVTYEPPNENSENKFFK